MKRLLVDFNGIEDGSVASLWDDKPIPIGERVLTHDEEHTCEGNVEMTAQRLVFVKLDMDTWK